ncbi:MAG: 3'(2'),5'-bisphosphate nucleotidase CysQ [Mesorhizobium sp.]|nr:3'(2'),5'-bisphosphate nucleotidase CysQ [Mesorhizobium sp.]MCO5160295.1 3'(2'),5'-bisphosphate nucleotidase CysQ [Mesorhizobium sp.]
MPAADAIPAGLEADLELIAEAARAGGEIALRHFGRKHDIRMKPGDSPVTQADIAVDSFLRETLRKARPAYGWLSEETLDTPDRLLTQRLFVVDPIDGTRAFIDNRQTWCVSIAVVEAGRPLVGVLACPAIGEFYSAALGGGSYLDGRRLALGEPGPSPAIAGPKPMVDAARAQFPALRTVPYIPSLAYRVAMVAAGRIDATFVKPKSHDWDLAAADLVLSEAGGGILSRGGQSPSYGGIDPRHGSLVAGGPYLLDRLSDILIRQDA